MIKPIIGISGSELIDESGAFAGYRRSYVNQDYVDAVVLNGGIPYIIPYNSNSDVIFEQVKYIDGLILSGGHDVNPHLYGEEPLQKIGEFWSERDYFDSELLSLAEQKKIPVLGICRGMQLLNVVYGGSLYQDLSYRKEPTIKHDQKANPTFLTHSMTVKKDSKLFKILGETKFLVNSFHHQIIKQLAPDFKATAYAPDGVLEGIENKAGSILAVQWHPEMLHKNRNAIFMNNLFKFLVNGGA